MFEDKDFTASYLFEKSLICVVCRRQNGSACCGGHEQVCCMKKIWYAVEKRKGYVMDKNTLWALYLKRFSFRTSGTFCISFMRLWKICDISCIFYNIIVHCSIFHNSMKDIRHFVYLSDHYRKSFKQNPVFVFHNIMKDMRHFVFLSSHFCILFTLKFKVTYVAFKQNAVFIFHNIMKDMHHFVFLSSHFRILSTKNLRSHMWHCPMSHMWHSPFVTVVTNGDCHICDIYMWHSVTFSICDIPFVTFSNVTYVTFSNVTQDIHRFEYLS